MNRYVILLGLILVALAIAPAVSAQQVFFADEASCLSAKPGTFQYYTNTGQTRMKYWQARVEAGTATFEELKADLCANERSVDPTAPRGERDAFRIVRLQKGTPAFFVRGTPVADGRCGNDFTWAEYVPPEPETTLPPKPQPEPPPQPVVRREPPPLVVVPEPLEECPECLRVEIRKLDKNGKLLKLTAKIKDDKYVSGEWRTEGGRVVGTGNDLLVSYKRLERLFGKKRGQHKLRFLGKDAHGHEITCEGEIVIQKKGRFWVFKIPGLNCLYAWTADIGNWSAWGAVEKLGCAAAGAGAYFAVGPEGLVKHGYGVFVNLP